MSNSLIQKVEEWINKTGYGLEMRAATLFKQAGLATIQGEFYFDPQSGTPREIDIVVYEPHGLSSETAAIFVVAECKRSDKPWVLFSADRQFPAEGSVQQRVTTKQGHQILARLSMEPSVQKLSIFQLPSHLGYSLVAANLGSADKDKDGGDRAYKALLSATNAAEAVLSSLESKIKDVFAVALPLIILEGELIQAVLDSQGQLDLKQIDHGVLAWRNPRRSSHTFVTVATEPALPRLIPTLSSGMREFIGLAAAQIRSSEAGGG